MKLVGSTKKFVTISLLAFFVSLITLVFGAPLLRVIRKTYGAGVYWTEGLVLITLIFLFKSPLVATLVGSMWIAVGAYIELEVRGHGWWKSGLFGLFWGILYTAGSVIISFNFRYLDAFDALSKGVQGLLIQMKNTNTVINIDPASVVLQLPSIAASILILGLAFGLIFEKSVFALTGFSRERVASELRLLEFKVPESFIWVALTSLLISVVDFKVRALGIVGTNMVNIAALLYFFQGVAVIEVFLNSFRAGFLLRTIIYISIIGQMFVVVSFIGLIDFWIDFRGRAKKILSRSN